MMRSSFGNTVIPLVYLLTLHISPCRTSEIVSRSSVVVPAPLSVSPAQNFEGLDGDWNAFIVQLGSPAQTVRLYPSTSIQQIWTVDSVGCDGASKADCDRLRGGDFVRNSSTTWREKGLYKLDALSNLGTFDPSRDFGQHGFDTVTVGATGENLPAVKNQVIATFATMSFPYGYLGINPKKSNFTDINDSYDSYMATLRKQNMIPSISWGYTAGAPYRFNGVISSLTLGGYDSSRFVPNNITFQLDHDNERDIVVLIRGINSVASNGAVTNLVPQSFTNPMYTYIDSSTPQIWLPKEVCDVFEKTFNLTYNSTTDLYHVSELAHQQLIASNPNITFSLGSSTVSETVQISLPYSAFDKTLLNPYPNIAGQQRYFPLRRAANNTQYTLGRTFLQEAYLTVDWERQTFSVHQCDWIANAAKHIVAIPSSNSSTGASHGTLGAGVIAGIVVAVAVALSTLVALAVILHRRRNRKERAQRKAEEMAVASSLKSISSHETVDNNDNIIPKAELDATQTPIDQTGTFYNPDKANDIGSPAESDASYTWLNPVEADSKQREIFEMPGDEPKMPEADGRQFSEKEAMRAREERYNGVDMYDPQTPVSIDARLRQPPISPHEVVELVDRVGPRGNPVSPIDGSDGSRTMVFSPLSPLEGTVINISPDSTAMPERRRFSYED